MDHRTPLADAVRQYRNEDRISFHVPGHKGNGSEESTGLKDFFDAKVLRADLTELPGLDDLHQPDSVIREAQQLAAQLFGAEETFFLVNGTSAGMTAAIAAHSSEKKHILLERNTHECTTRGMILSGAGCRYVYNSFDYERRIPSGVPASELEELDRKGFHPAALVVTHPSYYGTYSNLKELIETAHRLDMIVIVDEAHGAQLTFSDQKEIPSALSAGADLVVQSTHKMLGSLTQSSMLHVQGNRVDRERLQFYLRFMTSTSPSYLLMSSLDLVRSSLQDNGRDAWKKIAELTVQTRKVLNRIEGISCPSHFLGSDGILHPLESTRLLISAAALGLSGRELSSRLAFDYGIDAEFADYQYAVLLAGVGTEEQDMEALIRAIRTIAADIRPDGQDDLRSYLKHYEKAFLLRPDQRMTPRQATQAGTLCLDAKMAEGMVSARDLSMYPPGVPVVRAGEMLSKELIQYIEEGLAYGMEFHGIAEAGKDGKPRFFCAEDERNLEFMNGFF